MKKIRVLLSMILVLALVLFAACANKTGVKDSEDAFSKFDQIINEYANSNEVNFEISLVKGEESKNIKIQYVFENSKVKSLAAVLTNSMGEVSVYVLNNKAYTARYDSPKTYYDVSDDEAKALCSDYNFKALLDSITDLYTKSFFKACEIKENTKEHVTLTCNTASLEVDDSLDTQAYFEMQDLIEKLQSLTSVEVEMAFENDKLVKFVGKNVNSDGVASVLTISFLGTSSVSVSAPNTSDYQAK